MAGLGIVVGRVWRPFMFDMLNGELSTCHPEFEYITVAQKLDRVLARMGREPGFEDIRIINQRRCTASAGTSGKIACLIVAYACVMTVDATLTNTA